MSLASKPVLATDSGSGELEFANDEWRLRVRVGARLDPYELIHLPTGECVADQSYCYQVTVGSTGESGYRGAPAACRGVRPLGWTVDGDTLVLTGVLDLGPAGPTDVRLEHRIALCPGGSVQERLSLIHHHGRDRHALSGLRFGFRKRLFDRSSSSWLPGADGGLLIPLPLRRRAGQSTDYHLAAYTPADLMPEEWTRAGLPGRGAEAWLWSCGDFGFLVAKYNQEHIEFGLADGEFVPGAAEDGAALQVMHLNSHQELCLRFGGAGVWKDCPEAARELAPGAVLTFGTTIIRTFDGDWQHGAATYKAILRDLGHVVPPAYEPPVHWNELYRLGWRCGGNAPLQELPDLWAEAALARAAGAQAFYFDPGWDLFEGSSVWDTDRLGPLETFVERLRSEFGLSLALHLMMHTKSLDEDPDIYRRRRDGEIDVWLDNTPYAGGYICPGSATWQRQKITRLCALADAGVSFFMFDFLSYGRAMVEATNPDRADPGPCWSAEHGHSVPLTREEHAEGILVVIRAVRRRFPTISVEAHDRIGGEFSPLYYQHGPADAHTELWGFEYMWDPYADLLSGKALSLYEYNLSYDIPLYLHINSAHDSPQMLSFWWYASTCRHLGIGGIDESSARWPAQAAAMSVYRGLQRFFAQGEFVGIDPMTHLHVLAREDAAVLVAFNLSASVVRRSVLIPAMILPFDQLPTVRGAAGHRSGDALVLDLVIEPMSPLVVEIRGTGPAAAVGQPT